MPVNSKPIPMEDVAARIISNGLTGRQAVALLATIWGESGGNAFAINGPIVKLDETDPAHLSLDRGIAQWNSGWWPDMDNQRAFDWEESVDVMCIYVKSAPSLAEGLLNWNVFKSLAFIDHVLAAQEAVTAAGG